MNDRIPVSTFLNRRLGVAKGAAVLILSSTLSVGCSLPDPVRGEAPSIPTAPQQAAARDQAPSLLVRPSLEEVVEPVASPSPLPKATLETYCWSIRTDYYHGPCDEAPVFVLIAKYWVPSRPGSTVVRVEGPTSDAVVAKALAKVLADVDSLEPWERALVAR